MPATCWRAACDELVHAIVATLAGRLADADAKRSLIKPPDSLTAYDCYLRALDLDRKFDPDSSSEGLELSKKAIELDPNFARGHALLATTTVTIVCRRHIVACRCAAALLHDR